MRTQAQMGDQEIMGDMLATQKLITHSYNMFSNECSCQNLKNDMMNILRDEQGIQSSVFQDMNRRGWYQPETAPQQKVQETREKFEGIAQGLC